MAYKFWVEAALLAARFHTFLCDVIDNDPAGSHRRKRNFKTSKKQCMLSRNDAEDEVTEEVKETQISNPEGNECEEIDINNDGETSGAKNGDMCEENISSEPVEESAPSGESTQKDGEDTSPEPTNKKDNIFPRPEASAKPKIEAETADDAENHETLERDDPEFPQPEASFKQNIEADAVANHAPTKDHEVSKEGDLTLRESEITPKSSITANLVDDVISMEDRVLELPPLRPEDPLRVRSSGFSAVPDSHRERSLSFNSDVDHDCSSVKAPRARSVPSSTLPAPVETEKYSTIANLHEAPSDGKSQAKDGEKHKGDDIIVNCRMSNVKMAVGGENDEAKTSSASKPTGTTPSDAPLPAPHELDDGPAPVPTCLESRQTAKGDGDDGSDPSNDSCDHSQDGEGCRSETAPITKETAGNISKSDGESVHNTVEAEGHTLSPVAPPPASNPNAVQEPSEAIEGATASDEDPTLHEATSAKKHENLSSESQSSAVPVNQAPTNSLISADDAANVAPTSTGPTYEILDSKSDCVSSDQALLKIRYSIFREHDTEDSDDEHTELSEQMLLSSLQPRYQKAKALGMYYAWAHGTPTCGHPDIECSACDASMVRLLSFWHSHDIKNVSEDSHHVILHLEGNKAEPKVRDEASVNKAPSSDLQSSVGPRPDRESSQATEQPKAIISKQVSAILSNATDATVIPSSCSSGEEPSTSLKDLGDKRTKPPSVSKNETPQPLQASSPLAMIKEPQQAGGPAMNAVGVAGKTSPYEEAAKPIEAEKEESEEVSIVKQGNTAALPGVLPNGPQQVSSQPRPLARQSFGDKQKYYTDKGPNRLGTSTSSTSKAEAKADETVPIIEEPKTSEQPAQRPAESSDPFDDACNRGEDGHQHSSRPYETDVPIDTASLPEVPNLKQQRTHTPTAGNGAHLGEDGNNDVIEDGHKSASGKKDVATDAASTSGILRPDEPSALTSDVGNGADLGEAHDNDKDGSERSTASKGKCIAADPVVITEEAKLDKRQSHTPAVNNGVQSEGSCDDRPLTTGRDRPSANNIIAAKSQTVTQVSKTDITSTTSDQLRRSAPAHTAPASTVPAPSGPAPSVPASTVPAPTVPLSTTTQPAIPTVPLAPATVHASIQAAPAPTVPISTTTQLIAPALSPAQNSIYYGEWEVQFPEKFPGEFAAQELLEERRERARRPSSSPKSKAYSSPKNKAQNLNLPGPVLEKRRNSAKSPTNWTKETIVASQFLKTERVHGKPTGVVKKSRSFSAIEREKALLRRLIDAHDVLIAGDDDVVDMDEDHDMIDDAGEDENGPEEMDEDEDMVDGN